MEVQQLLTDEEYRDAKNQFGEDAFEAEMGAEAVRKLLMNLDLVSLSEQLRTEMQETNSKQRKKDLINRLKLVEAIRDSENRQSGWSWKSSRSFRLTATVGSFG